MDKTGAPMQKMEVEGKQPQPDYGAGLNKRGDSAHQDVESHLVRKSLVDAKGYVRDEREQYDDDGHVQRTGTFWTAASHIITAVIGSGVLSLAWAVMYLGWVAGPLLLIAFAIITWYYSVMLVDAYRYPNVDGPTRNYTYIEAVRRYLGKPYEVCCGLVQYINMFGTGIGYTVTGAISIVAIQRGNCLRATGADPSGTECTYTNNYMIIFFGGLQLILSQIQDFDRLWWLSVLAAVMSFTYSFIGLGLSIAKTAEWKDGHSTGTVDGIQVPGDTTWSDKGWNITVALGSIAFAYSYSYILLEMTDTVKYPENKPMRKAVGVSVAVTTFFYIAVGVFGYAAFGNNNPGTPGNLLAGGGFINPYWLIDLANAAIFIHLLGELPVWTQPLFSFVEQRIFMNFPNAMWMQKDLASFYVPGLGLFRINVFRLLWRSLYVALTTLLAALLPFFNDIVGLLGAVGFWPLTIFFPTQIYMVQNGIQRWSFHWAYLQAISMFCLVVSIAAAVGSVKGIITDAANYAPFQSVQG
ncbi:hypothetical protein WJX81_004074 [Elliptochloris bilobata]|uniref:Amino acid transporter transmembrane domain-containing protein n=1 Tax=Elliptochloris bilobata TaxID=381761 RepID=A0AAW1QNH6_9CHLO